MTYSRGRLLESHPILAMTDLWEDTLDQSHQVCWHERPQGLQVCSSAGQLVSPFNLATALQKLAPSHTGESLPGVLAGGLHSRSHAHSCRSSDLARMIPGADLGIPQLHCQQFLVTEEGIRKEDRAVKSTGETLVIALMADRLASEAEKVRGQEGHPDSR